VVLVSTVLLVMGEWEWERDCEVGIAVEKGLPGLAQ
jgi:hypothetical protein